MSRTVFQSKVNRVPHGLVTLNGSITGSSISGSLPNDAGGTLNGSLSEVQGISFRVVSFYGHNAGCRLWRCVITVSGKYGIRTQTWNIMSVGKIKCLNLYSLLVGI